MFILIAIGKNSMAPRPFDMSIFPFWWLKNGETRGSLPFHGVKPQQASVPYLAPQRFSKGRYSPPTISSISGTVSLEKPTTMAEKSKDRSEVELRKTFDAVEVSTAGSNSIAGSEFYIYPFTTRNEDGTLYVRITTMYRKGQEKLIDFREETPVVIARGSSGATFNGEVGFYNEKEGHFRVTFSKLPDDNYKFEYIGADNSQFVS